MNPKFRESISEAIRSIACVTIGIGVIALSTYAIFISDMGMEWFTFMSLLVAGVSACLLTFDKLRTVLARHSKKNVDNNFHFRIFRTKNTSNSNRRKYGLATKI